MYVAMLSFCAQFRLVYGYRSFAKFSFISEHGDMRLEFKFDRTRCELDLGSGAIR